VHLEELVGFLGVEVLEGVGVEALFGLGGVVA